jgi:hypothetical protein
MTDIPKIIFIVPYRDRENQKNLFLRQMKYVLEDIPSTDYKIYFSRVIRYRLMGYLLENNPHTLMDYLLCTKCFERINNYEACVICKTEFRHKYPFFLNCNYFYNHKEYKQLQRKHNLQVIQEYYRDERMSMFYEDIEEDIIKIALHPDRIDKIHYLTNCSIEDIDKYI